MEVERTRDKDDGLLRLFPANLTGDSLFGLTEAAVSKMTESVRMEIFLCGILPRNLKQILICLLSWPISVTRSGPTHNLYFQTRGSSSDGLAFSGQSKWLR